MDKVLLRDIRQAKFDLDHAQLQINLSHTFHRVAKDKTSREQIQKDVREWSILCKKYNELERRFLEERIFINL
jgi:DnaJ-domain-containing protein 1